MKIFEAGPRGPPWLLIVGLITAPVLMFEG